MIDDPTQISPATATLPFVSVIVPIYNGEGDLPDLVDCLQQQTYPAERTEYLLVDNNSGDRTASLLKTLVQTSHPMQICLLQESTIQSSYAARNVGIREVALEPSAGGMAWTINGRRHFPRAGNLRHHVESRRNSHRLLHR